MKEFLEAIEANAELKAKMEELDKNPETKPADYIALAKEYGYELTEEDFQSDGELSDDELAAVTGAGDCTWVMGGGGSAGDGNPTCACGGVGFGEYNSVGSGKYRCACGITGSGKAD